VCGGNFHRSCREIKPAEAKFKAETGSIAPDISWHQKAKKFYVAQMFFAVMLQREITQAVRLPIGFFAILFSSWP
jgi:hypothetical protein